MDKGALRTGAIAVALSSILLIPQPRPGDSIAKTLFEAALETCAFAAIPIITKLWPLPEDRLRVSMKLWGPVLGLFFFGKILIWRKDDLFPHNPLLGNWLEYGLLTSMWVVAILAFLLRPRRDNMPERFASRGRN